MAPNHTPLILAVIFPSIIYLISSSMVAISSSVLNEPKLSSSIMLFKVEEQECQFA